MRQGLKPSRQRKPAEEFQQQNISSGDLGGGDTPDPIPNSEVKTSSADDTAVLTVGK
jgi:hypothetical protein